MIIDRPTELDVPSLRALWREAFSDGDAFLDMFFDTAYSPDRARVARLDGAIIGALYWFDCEVRGKKCAYIYAVATAISHRGLGVCKTLMEDTHKHLRDNGYEACILVPGSPGLFRFYEKLGYKICSSIGEMHVKAAEEPIGIEKTDKREFARLRRKYLPAGGALQEGVSLDLLEAQASFYKGDDFVLAAYKKENELIGLELLGNTTEECAAAITRALGADLARFRTPGDERPFAMYYPLCDDAFLPPQYFGLAFD